MSEEKKNQTPETAATEQATEQERAKKADQAAERAAELQQADPSVQTTSEPSDSPAQERKEQEEGTAEAAGMAANADAGVEAGPVEGLKEQKSTGKEQQEESVETETKPAEKKQEKAATAQEGQASSQKPADDADKEAKRKAAEEARAARAAAREARAAGRAKEEGAAEEKPKEPSPNQPKLDRLVEILTESLGQEAIEAAWINELSKDMPMVEVKVDRWLECADVLRNHPELKLNYLSNIVGVDRETHMEVVYHIISLETKLMYGFKVKTDRDNPSVPSVTPIWSTANWQERETYDLLGIDFPGHPDLRRIMLPDDWVGHPLRKDYEPIDPEV